MIDYLIILIPVVLAGLLTRVFLHSLLKKSFIESVNAISCQTITLFEMTYPNAVKKILLFMSLFFWGLGVVTAWSQLDIVFIYIIYALLILLSTCLACYVHIWKVRVVNDEIYVRRPFRRLHKYNLAEIKYYRKGRLGWEIVHLSGRVICTTPPLIGPDLLYNYFLSKKLIFRN